MRLALEKVECLMKLLTDPLQDPLVDAVEHTLTRYHMVSKGDRVLVGFSGGPDSTAILICLYYLADKHGLSLGAAHLNHGLRGEEAARDARHAACFASILGIPCVVETHSVDVYRRAHRLSPEEAAREVRYRFLQRTAMAGGFNRIALGHHRDDNAESMLIRILRGSGPLGLGGIPPTRSGPDGLTFVRPLIRNTRNEIAAFLKRSEVAAVQDQSNADIRLLRNRIRHHLIPLLTRDYNPALAEGLSRLARLMRDEEDWLNEITAKSLATLTLADHGTLLILDRQRLAACHPSLQRRVLRAAVAKCKGHLRRLSFASLETLRDFVVQGPVEGVCDLPDGLEARGSNDRLEVQQFSHRPGKGRRPRRRPPDTYFEYPISSTGRFVIPEAGVTMDFSLLRQAPRSPLGRTGQEMAFFDMDQLRFPLLVRNFRPGDRMAPLGLEGTQKVKKIFIDRKIARQDRPRYPLLLSGGQILWIAGLRQSEIGKIGPETKLWLKVEVTGCL